MSIQLLPLVLLVFPLIIFLDYHRRDNIYKSLLFLWGFYSAYFSIFFIIKLIRFDILYFLPFVFPLIFFIAWLKPRKLNKKQEDILDQ